MPRYRYTGDQKVTYSFYLDVSDPEKPSTLVPEPGQTYEIKQAEGHTQIQPDGDFVDAELAMPPDVNWSETTEPTWAEVAAKQAEAEAKEHEAEGSAPAAEPSPQPAPPARAKKKEQADG